MGMYILYIATLRESGRDAKTVEEFYYSKLAPPAYGVRALTADMIKAGKIINRYVCLHDTGDTLTIITLFRDEAAQVEWHEHPIMKETLEKWADRDWSWDIQAIPCHDIVDVSKWDKE
jgi:hypothetical protein